MGLAGWTCVVYKVLMLCSMRIFRYELAEGMLERITNAH